ncbi:NAD(P)/FAD-dependent oxidoreductase [Streptomyces auratus]|uniref:Oxidoreductase n=1 Tax=Streptomyces auratus AGR0001 TaxID=1160718 RepID=A0A8B1NVG0_9ACTN|nr:FAD-dependent oxidoreductase [Streptomyces auratus]QTZ91502.1 oxidoreductase [Streptomyces auratus AGR0001]
MSEQSKSSQAPDRTPRVVIVGAGIAGVQTAVALREQGWRSAITLLGDEPHQPYDRPPLSKAVLLGKAEGSTFDVDFAALGIDLHLNRPVTGLVPEARQVETAAGPISYDYAVLATGPAPIMLPGSEGLPGVHLLRTLDDAERLRPVLAAQHEIVVVGAGWIGAEFATAAREAGCAVTVVEAADRPLAGALPPEVATHMTGWYADAGAELRTGARVASVTPGAVTLEDGTTLPADAVVVGIGARPATGWLAGSGVEVSPQDGSVLADGRLRTSVPGVYAVGDCASFPSARYGSRLLIHHWDNALQGPRTVAENIARGGTEGLVYDPVPYFWSEQFGRFVQYAGYHVDADDLVWRGDPTGAAWSVLWLRSEEGVSEAQSDRDGGGRGAGRLVALLAVGRPRDLAQGRKLIERGVVLDRDRAANASVPLKAAAL